VESGGGGKWLSTGKSPRHPDRLFEQPDNPLRGLVQPYFSDWLGRELFDSHPAKPVEH
jgi:hypothetical protein